MFSLLGFHVFPRRVSCFPLTGSCGTPRPKPLVAQSRRTREIRVGLTRERHVASLVAGRSLKDHLAFAHACKGSWLPAACLVAQPDLAPMHAAPSRTRPERLNKVTRQPPRGVGRIRVLKTSRCFVPSLWPCGALFFGHHCASGPWAADATAP